MDKRFAHEDAERGIYDKWESAGYFSPSADGNGEPFSIVLPPPNVTGELHMGHAAMLAIEDIMVRFARMRGRRTLWIPGTDHAAIATQSKVEKELYKKEGKTRRDLGREAFLKRVEEFALKSHDTIVNQVRAMGASLDWSREAYTLDALRSRAVKEAFKRMYDGGVIYRGSRIVNWDPKLQTTVSDDEIDWKEMKGFFYYLQYGPFVIGTARPETKFGDKYVVMHPADARYAKYKHGEKLELEWINGPVTATVIKDEAADPAFGTGVMTITPWHDATDFEIAERHSLDKEQIIDFNGKLLPIAREFAGFPIAKARLEIVKKLEKKGLLVKVDENYVHRVATNSRGGGIIEPQIMKQWFVDVHKKFSRDGREISLKDLMRDTVASGKIKILPERFVKVYFNWIDNLRDWCISRQLWYGHRVPAWYKGGETYVGPEPPGGSGWEEDQDTLDTWFSSGLWTFSTLGWPEESEDLKMYHPTSVLETAYDILFFWVARMILMTGYLLNDIPFRTVYLHGIVRDKEGRKMSKSLDNGIDPLEMVQKYGADATRMSLIMGVGAGSDTNLSEDKIRACRNFATKIWNAARFLDMRRLPNVTISDVNHSMIDIRYQSILTSLEKVKAEITAHLEAYELHLAAEKAYDYFWNTFANKILEDVKKEGITPDNYTLLLTVFRECLKLLHPFMPFVTEAAYEALNFGEGKKMLIGEEW